MAAFGCSPRQAEFAERIGIEVETLSRIENDHVPVSGRTDRFIRMYYTLLSKDPVLVGQLEADIDTKLTNWHRITAPQNIVATVKDNEWQAELVGA